MQLSLLALLATAVAFAACIAGPSGDDTQTSAVDQALGSGGGSGGSGSGSGPPPPMMKACPAEPPATPPAPSCGTANKMLTDVAQIQTAGAATGTYPVGVGETQPSEGEITDTCERAWMDCVDDHLLPQEATYCTQICRGACAAPSGPGQAGTQGFANWTKIPCGSTMCWQVTCPQRGCGAIVGCCVTLP